MSNNGSKWLQLSVFTLLLLAPLMVWLVAGTPPPYEGREFTEIPPLPELLADASAPREQAADALLERSWLRKWANAQRNWFTWNVLGYVDNERVVSGSEGFLYLKHALRTFDCGAQARGADLSGRLALLGALARAAGVDLLFSVSPNKASIHSSELVGRAALYSNCYAAESAAQRLALERAGGGLVLYHQASIQRLAGLTEQTYLKTDTHWRRHTLVAVVRDLYAHYDHPASEGVMRVPSVQAPNPVVRDLNSLLLLRSPEADLVPDAQAFSTWLEVAGQLPGRTLVLHDSFYEWGRTLLKDVFASSEFLHLQRLKGIDLPARLAAADRIIVNVVERDAAGTMQRVLKLLWPEVQRRNAAAARQRCSVGAGIPTQLQATATHNLADLGGGRYRSVGRDAQIHVDTSAVESGDVCVGLVMTASEPFDAQLFVAAPEQAFSEAASLRFPRQRGRLDVDLLLPAGEVQRIRFDPARSADFEFTLEGLVGSE